MPVNLQLIQQEFEAAGIFNIWADYNGDLSWNEANPPTQQQINTATALVAAHNSAAATTKQQASSAYAASGASNAGRLKYFMYFVALQNEVLAVMSDPALTEQQCFTRLLAALKQDKANNADHLFAFSMFLRESSRKNNVAVTETVLNNLAYPARRTFYDEVQTFYLQGLMAGLSVILKNGS